MAIPTKSNLIKTYGDEAKKVRELTELGSLRTTTSNVSWTSSTSSVTYDTAASSDPNVLNKGEDGLLYLLANIEFIDNIIDADYLTEVIASITKSSLVYGEDGGASDSYAIALEIAPTAYTNGMVINFKANTANTGACSLNVNGLGAVAIKDVAGNDLATGAILAGQSVSAIYNGTHFVMLSDSKYLNTPTIGSPTINTPIITTPTLRNWDGWIDANETWTYASATSFTISGDLTGKYQKGDKIKLTQTTVKYFYVVSVSYSAPNTTITITSGTDYTLVSAAISANFYSKVENPQGFPHWFNYTPTYGASGSMTYGSVTTTYAKFKIAGNTVSVDIRVTGTTGGTASNTITASLPITSSRGDVNGTGLVADTGLLGGIIYLGTTSLLYARKYDSANFGLGAGRIIIPYIEYEMA